MGYWKSKVLPKIQKVFETNSSKKTAAAEACKSFDDSKEGINKEFEDKKTEIQAKVVEIYEASSVEIKTLVKERKESGIKKSSAEVHKFLEELAKIEFPGSKQVCEASSKFGPRLVSGPVFFVFEKVSTFVITEEKPETETTTEETSGKEKEKEVVVEEEKKEKEIEKEEEIKTSIEEVKEKTEPCDPVPVPTEPVKVEESCSEPAKP